MYGYLRILKWLLKVKTWIKILSHMSLLLNGNSLLFLKIEWKACILRWYPYNILVGITNWRYKTVLILQLSETLKLIESMQTPT